MTGEAPFVCLSKHHQDFPAYPTGRDYPFKIGDRAIYRRVGESNYNGSEVVIDSDIMRSLAAADDSTLTHNDGLVYEVVWPDGSRSSSALENLHHINEVLFANP